MSDKVEIGEIVYCDLKVEHKGNRKVEIIELNGVVYKNDGSSFFYRKRNLDEFKIHEPVKIVSIKVRSRLGFENKGS